VCSCTTPHRTPRNTAQHNTARATCANHAGGGWKDPYIGFHPGGEFKGIRPTYGAVTNDEGLLFGARRPHKPYGFELQPGEVRGLAGWVGAGSDDDDDDVDGIGCSTSALSMPETAPTEAPPPNRPAPHPQYIVRVELQHDRVMRWMAFTTQLGRRFEWGFPNVTDAKSYSIYAPRDGSYLAAFRGFEGKQLPPELGGYTKRYIIQIGFVWAMRRCTAYEYTPPTAQNVAPNAARGGNVRGRAPPPPPLSVPPMPPYPPVIGLNIAPAPPLPPPSPPPPPPEEREEEADAADAAAAVNGARSAVAVVAPAPKPNPVATALQRTAVVAGPPAPKQAASLAIALQQTAAVAAPQPEHPAPIANSLRRPALVAPQPKPLAAPQPNPAALAAPARNSTVRPALRGATAQLLRAYSRLTGRQAPPPPQPLRVGA